jgi:hypothetical protein
MLPEQFKRGHPKERFSEPTLSLKTVHAYEWFLESFFENFNM